MTPCPRCGGKLAKGKTRKDGKYILRYRSCAACDYSERAKFLPEVLIETVPVQKRTKSILNLPLTDPVSPVTLPDSLESQAG
jgi:hypothetical protein